MNECVAQSLLSAETTLKINTASSQDKLTETKLFPLLKEQQQKTQIGPARTKMALNLQ